MTAGEIYITIKEFASRIGYSYSSAYNMAHSKYFRDKRIAEKMNLPGKKGGIRIHWQRYLATRQDNPIIAEYVNCKRVHKDERRYWA